MTNIDTKMHGKILAAAGAVSAVGARGVGVATAASGDDAEAPLTAAALGKARDASIEHLGGGRVSDTEAGDQGRSYGSRSCGRRQSSRRAALPPVPGG